MTLTTLTSREFDQDTGGAKRVAESGPVFIADRGRLAQVLLTIEDDRPLTDGAMGPSGTLAQCGEVDFEFNSPRVTGGSFKPADLD